LGAGIGSLEVEAHGKLSFIRRKPPIIHTSRYVPRAPKSTPADPTGQRQCSKQETRGGATWKHAVSQNPAVLDQIFCRTPYNVAGGGEMEYDGRVVGIGASVREEGDMGRSGQIGGGGKRGVLM
jgi:hypothetical protein